MRFLDDPIIVATCRTSCTDNKVLCVDASTGQLSRLTPRDLIDLQEHMLTLSDEDRKQCVEEYPDHLMLLEPGTARLVLLMWKWLGENAKLSLRSLSAHDICCEAVQLANTARTVALGAFL